MTAPTNKKHSPQSFALMKQKGQKITMITAYDFASGSTVANTDIDVILVGDSLGMVILGLDSTLKVSMEDMISHGAATVRGAPQKFVIIDMPYMSYHLSARETRINAARLVNEGAGDAVKLEGGSPGRIQAIREIVDMEIPVCAHLGLTPQSVLRFGGYKVQGKSEAAYEEIFRAALAAEEAGAFMLVLEAIPESLGQKISSQLSIPTIGIGAGRYCDGQVLVYHDLLGYSNMSPKFVKRYSELNQSISASIMQYSKEVREGSFPGREQTYYPIEKQEG
ncbi:MAG: 3-methyl-2-oxobutanoate hydroxymethyltransferase [Candidatus Cloacimonadaceae bacterium]|jgi:3-methyl-2-oxobutanoate hydroxymethyltransferase|nr:3-methyl-2-oxobutanoate hydroxymethyltransferase [Candidatus Cloacimonadota bacterium]MDY0128434.1 3-methyl-2-oxobutanoate hydroxymethyltransferase [Candidatus Cloacimonadaceae bacterium]MCB5254912.1 3-methyl-2-oxobutanoate hydroxymethyltransferase [Candidatus Cloacimonadota bacterium]MCK9178955.1 3-methyl-2-oxobutanoate hydroxymethyltransferase [Candidatus Cloacimonadota bacterium]MCK9243200.1 3-methyl-2-oxobutanoate hydroxymethyltransferase [Candidatus Cloacimonadota bacterium]